MGKKSEYNETLKKEKTLKFRELENLLPIYIHPYLDSMIVDYQINTLIAYTRDLITFFEFLLEMNPTLKNKEIKDIPASVLENLTIQDITEYRNYLSLNEGIHEHSNQASSIERRMAPLRGFFNDAYTTGILKVNPTILLNRHKRKRTHKKEVIYMNHEEVENFMYAVENTMVKSENQQKFCERTKYRDKAIITLMLHTGIRISECVGLDLDDVNFRNHTIRIVRKGGDEASLFFNVEVSEALFKYIELERPHFINDDNEKALFLSSQKKRMAVRSIQMMVKKYARESVSHKNITPHKLRSSYGTNLYEVNSDIFAVSERLGHRNLNTALCYVTASEKKKKEAGMINPYE